MNKPVIGLTASHDLLTDDLKMGHFYRCYKKKWSYTAGSPSHTG